MGDKNPKKQPKKKKISVDETSTISAVTDSMSNSTASRKK